MDREAAKQYVKDQLENYLQSKGIDTRHPFKCLNPAHVDKRPSMSIDRTSGSGLHCKCFSCGAYYDTFDLIGIDYGLTDEAEIFKKAYELFNLDVDGYTKRDYKPTTHHKVEQVNKETPDFTGAVQAAHEALKSNPEALKYLKSRGLSKTIKKYKIGYDKAGYNHFLQAYPQNQSRSQKAGLYRYIFPYPNTEGHYSYFIAEIEDRAQIDEYNGKYRKISKMAAQIFNERYLQTPPSVIFVCEGIYDALSVEEVGGSAIAFTGTSHGRFLRLCEKYRPDTTFVLSLDNDEAGRQATTKVINGLEELGISYRVGTPQHGKDMNEALQADREAFREYVQQTITDIEQEKKDKEDAERQTYLQTSTAYHLQSFIDDIEANKTATFFPTGFPSIDNLLDGGLYAGLYVVGAITSLGKTTFAQNIVDNIASSGHDVIVFSLEMARSELIAKSVSRHTVLEDRERYNTTVHAKTMRGITTGSRYGDYTQTDLEIIEAAITAYSKYANHIYIHEGVGNIGVERIKEVVDQHIRITGNKPVVMIDYVQILAPYNVRATDKQNTDDNMRELKRLSRDYAIPVIGISSFNRSNYTHPVNMAAFKESGAVEYSSDVLIGLQYKGMDYEQDEKESDRQKRIRELLKEQISIAKSGEPQSIQVKVLKNRNGSKGSTVINFYPKFNLFEEEEADSESNNKNEWKTLEVD